EGLPGGYVNLSDLDEFLDDHGPHGPLIADATEPAWNGYLLTVACRYGWWADADLFSWFGPGARRNQLSGQDRLRRPADLSRCPGLRGSAARLRAVISGRSV